MTEKKLEDEKAETINRLLKKQSRPRNKRAAASALTHTEDSTPVPAGGAGGGEDAEGEGVPKDEQEEVQAELLQGPPTMYRWISTSRPVVVPPPASVTADSAVTTTDISMTEATASTVVAPPATMSLSFSVPASFIPTPPSDDGMQVDGGDAPRPVPAPKPLCSVEGCGKERKYRLVRGEWGQGACGIVCLKILEGR